MIINSNARQPGMSAQSSIWLRLQRSNLQLVQCQLCASEFSCERTFSTPQVPAWSIPRERDRASWPEPSPGARVNLPVEPRSGRPSCYLCAPSQSALLDVPYHLRFFNKLLLSAHAWGLIDKTLAFDNPAKITILRQRSSLLLLRVYDAMMMDNSSL
ncbi:uncharacterized protein BDW70DRAFT_125633 [Aspergillus foveolatus]|uniref:uncharacterized protein n=1 Tax=Aspergillus foveolatus TaxID=210207 RepID=UPI003CCCA554